jgi:hypothetical protein
MDLKGMLDGQVKIVRCRNSSRRAASHRRVGNPDAGCREPHSVIISTGTQPIGSTDPRWRCARHRRTTNFSPGIAKVISPNAG